MNDEFSTKVGTKKGPNPDYPTGFDVTCIVGHVDFSDNGTEPAEVTAFRLIAMHGAEGTFQFPHEDGRTISVTVEYGGLQLRG